MTESESTELDVKSNEEGASDESLSSSTHFAFDHKIFAVEGACFKPMHDNKEAALYVDLGEMIGAIPVRTICQEFGIDKQSSDAKLLQMVSSSLKFVKEIRPNDSIPTEILDGSASWTIEDKHRDTARGRITMQLVSWLSGDEEIIINASELEAMSNDPATKTKVQDAFKEIAEKLGVSKEDVTMKVEDIIRELGYVEALRDYYQKIKKIASNIDRLAVVYKRDRSAMEEITRMQVLIKPVVRRFDRHFDDVDGQTCEILTILKNFAPTVQIVRQVRDDLHQGFMIWGQMVKDWEGVPVEQDQTTDRLMKETYRFLAQNYIQSQSWRMSL